MRERCVSGVIVFVSGALFHHSHLTVLLISPDSAAYRSSESSPLASTGAQVAGCFKATGVQRTDERRGTGDQQTGSCTQCPEAAAPSAATEAQHCPS